MNPGGHDMNKRRREARSLFIGGSKVTLPYQIIFRTRSIDLELELELEIDRVASRRVSRRPRLVRRCPT